jgi:multidrug efflux system outer membrane protein
MKSSLCFATTLFCLGAALAGCTVGPRYERPAALSKGAVPTEFSSGPDWKRAEPSADLSRGEWWKSYHDPELDRLEDAAAVGNQQIATSAARLERARAMLAIAESGVFPHLDANSAYFRERTSANAPQNGKPAGDSHTFNNFVLSLQAGWEPDLWGRVRHEKESARAQLQASADDLESLRIAIQAEVATHYFAFRGAEADTEILRKAITSYRRSLELTSNRRAGGIATDLDVSQAETQLRSTEALLPATQLSLKRLHHAIATLCGATASDFVIPPSTNFSASVPGVPALLPSELLEHRPDVASAERQMAAANAEVGLAQVAFYPRVFLKGLAGLQSVDASTLFDWPSRFWAVGPTLEWPLFTGGRNRAALAAANASYSQTVAEYRQTVLAAFQEVEDQLAATELLERQLEAETAALTAARRTSEIASNRYRAGLVSYLEVATAQSVALLRERNVVQLNSERLAASAALIKSVGAGWSAADSLGLPPQPSSAAR